MVNTEQFIQNLSAQATSVNTVRPATYITRLLCVLLVYGSLAQWGLGLRDDLSVQLTRPFFVLELLLLSILLVSSAIASVLAMYPDAYQKRILIKLPYIFAGLIVGLIFVQLFTPQDPRMVMPDKDSHTVECALFIAMASALPAMLIFTLLRKGATLTPLQAGTLAVITASSIGALTLRLAEAEDDILHLLTWHYIPSIGFAMVGALLGRWLLKW